MIDVDLPALQSIILGYRALQGRWNDDSCSLIMRSNNEWFKMICFVDLPNLTSILNSGGGSFCDSCVVILESISET